MLFAEKKVSLIFMDYNMQEKLCMIKEMEPGIFTLLYADDKGMEAFSFFCLGENPSWSVSEVFLYLMRLYKVDFSDSNDDALKLINKEDSNYSDFLKFIRSEYFALYMDSKNYRYIKVKVFLGDTDQKGKSIEITLYDPCDFDEAVKFALSFEK